MDTTTFAINRIFIFSDAADISQEQQQFFLVSNHLNQHKVYNFDSAWKSPHFTPENYCFNAFNPCPLVNIIRFCISVESYLSLDSKLVAVWFGGRGLDHVNRVAFMICCYLLHIRSFSDSDTCLEFVRQSFSAIDQELFLTPSQIRYVKYYELLLRNSGVENFLCKLSHISLNTVPLFETSIVENGCCPNVIVTIHDDRQQDSDYHPIVVYKQYPSTSASYCSYSALSTSSIEINLSSASVAVSGDVNISVWHKNQSKMFSIWFHTAFVESRCLHFVKDVIDHSSCDIMHRFFDSKFFVDLIVNLESGTRPIAARIDDDSADYTLVKVEDFNCLMSM